jgi:hypothetical protein
MISLRNNLKLDQMLTRIFSSPKSTILGFGFGADLREFERECTEMKFYKCILNFLEVQDFYKAIVPDF